MVLRCTSGTRTLGFRPIATSAARRASQLSSSFDYCRDLVKKHDREHYLNTLLMPKAARAGVVAVRAYNVSLASVRENVSDAQIGRMRLLFWRSNIDQIYKTGEAPEQPILTVLAAAIREYKLTKQWILQMITSREDRLSDNPFSSLNEAEQYYDKTFSTALFLTLQCLGVQSMEADHAISHLGRAQGLTMMLHGIPYFAQQRKSLLPLDLCLHHGLTQESIVRKEVDQAMRDLVYDIAAQAHVHLEKACKLKSTLPKEALPAFLPAVSCRKYLSTLQRNNFDPFHPICARRDPWLLYRMTWKKLRADY